MTEETDETDETCLSATGLSGTSAYSIAYMNCWGYNAGCFQSVCIFFTIELLSVDIQNSPLDQIEGLNSG